MSKFDNELAEALYQSAGEGFADAEIGSVSELGWAAKFADALAIIIEDSQGFVGIDTFDTREELEDVWQEILDTYEEFDYGLIV